MHGRPRKLCAAGRLSEVRHTGCSGAAGASSGSVSPCVRSASRSPSSSSPNPVSARSKPPSLGCSGAASSRSPSSNSPNPVSARSKPPSFSSPSSSAKELAVPTRVQRQLIVGDHIVEFFAYGISRSIGQRSTSAGHTSPPSRACARVLREIEPNSLNLSRLPKDRPGPGLEGTAPDAQQHRRAAKRQVRQRRRV